MGVVVVLLVVGSAVWVYLDATRHKIGKTQDSSTSAGAWAAGTLLLWIFTLPFYLWNRKSLIQNAKIFPVEAKHRGLKIGLISTLGCIFLALIVGAAAEAQLPMCQSSEAKDVVGRVLTDTEMARSRGATFIDINDVEQRGFNESLQLRACAGMIVTTAGEDRVSYTIRWGNKKKGEFYIEAKTL